MSSAWDNIHSIVLLVGLFVLVMVYPMERSPIWLFISVGGWLAMYYLFVFALPSQYSP
jgi:hypothetical protein